MIGQDIPFRKIFPLLVGVALFSFSTATWSAALPEFYGVYAVQGDRFIEMPETKNVVGSGLNALFFSHDLTKMIALKVGPSGKFLVFDKTVANRISNIGIYQMVRKASEWKAESAIDFRLQPIKNQSEMIYIVPRHPLSDGAYIIHERGSTSFYLFHVGSGEILMKSRAQGPSSSPRTRTNKITTWDRASKTWKSETITETWDEQSKTWKRN